MTLPSPQIFELLSNELRWQIMQQLTEGDLRVNEIVAGTDKQMNMVSYHLKKLRDAGLVKARRSEADGRDIYYSLNLTRLYREFIRAGQALGFELHHLHSKLTQGPLRVLFVCTHNSARSQMAEALLRHYGGDFVEVFSAGTQPTILHPLVADTLQRFGVEIQQQTPEHVSKYQHESFDYVITVCDYAREVCPRIENDTQLHWGFPDPTRHDDPILRREAFFQIATQLDARIRYFLHSRESSSTSLLD